MVNKPLNFSLPGFIKLTRFGNLLIVALSQIFVALFFLNIHPEQYFHLGLLVISTMLIAASGYIINDYYDVKIDYLNKPKKVVVGKIIKRRVVMVMHTLINALGIGLGLLLSWKVFLLNFTTALLLWLYSNQLKRLPFIGNFIVALLTSLTLLVVAIYFENFNYKVWVFSVFAFHFSLVREIIKDMQDLKGDSAFGCYTLPIIWGLRKTKILLYTINVLFFIGALFIINESLSKYWFPFIFAVLLAQIVLMVKLYKADTNLHFKQLSGICKLVMLGGILSIPFL